MVVGGRELIDTLWNVNVAIGFVLNYALGINRYIMECKSNMPYWGQWLLCELIDTLWNVNVLLIHILNTDSNELIDTLWNVNEKVRQQ